VEHLHQELNSPCGTVILQLEQWASLAPAPLKNAECSYTYSDPLRGVALVRLASTPHSIPCRKSTLGSSFYQPIPSKEENAPSQSLLDWELLPLTALRGIRGADSPNQAPAHGQLPRLFSHSPLLPGVDQIHGASPRGAPIPFLAPAAPPRR
jgi:hypothetical protein